jgi:hypothetical protein
MLILNEIEQNELTIEIAAVAAVKGGKIVTDKKQVMGRVWTLVRQEVDHIGNEDGEATRTAQGLYQDVARVLADIETKPLREFDANQFKYLAAVLQQIKEMGR